MSLVTRPALKAAGCANCRNFILQAFTSVYRPTSAHASLPPRRRLVINRPQLRYISETHQHVEQKLQGEKKDVTPTLTDNAESQPVEEQTGAVSSLPWYLQVETPSHKSPTLLDRQKLPELPSSPPPILEPLLEHILIDLGLDDLSVLDLRHLDPPPALGANLLMIIGTARSEKHLHVSADRLCRWLRREHKLRPDADGLLGRGELKLKLRRKARRMKLLGNRADGDNFDDGISTGWVCVSVGNVAPAESESQILESPKNFIGFGTRSNGVKIVVQMLVEEKRLEVDLEGLWNGISRRQLSSNADAEEEDQPNKLDEVSPTDEVLKNDAPDSFSQKRPYPQTRTPPRNGPFTQTRSFSTSGASRVAIENGFSHVESSASFGRPPDDSQGNLDFNTIRQNAKDLIARDDYRSARLLLFENRTLVPELRGEQWREQMLQSLIEHMEALPWEEAKQKLSKSKKSDTDRSSTPFLQYFYQTISKQPTVSEWNARIWLHCFARRIGCQYYTRSGLVKTFQEYQLSTVPIPRSTYIQVIRSLLRPLDDSILPHQPPSPLAMGHATSILQAMEERGEPVLTEDVFIALHESIAFYPDPAVDLSRQLALSELPHTTFYLPTRPPSDTHSRLNTILYESAFPELSEEGRLRMLEIFAAQHDWINFWEFWRSWPLLGQPRSAAMYAKMFGLVAKTRHQKGCMAVLRTWSLEMQLERPVVELQGEVLDEVYQCLKIADPDGRPMFAQYLQSRGSRGPGWFGEWAKLWERCGEAFLRQMEEESYGQ